MKYVRLVQFSLGTGKRPAAEAVADKVIPAIRKQPGCERAEFFMDEEVGEYGFVVLWTSKQAADDSYKVVYPIFSTAVAAAAVKGTPSIRTLEVYEPKH
jgi:quinol monooxygenase YgiN